MGHISLSNGRATAVETVVRKRVSHASSRSATNAWNINASNGNLNNNNKNNSNSVRAVVALGTEIKEGWIDAFFDCTRRKLSAKQCCQYRHNYEEDLWRLVGEVYDGTYKPSEAFCFVVTRPRIREIFAAAFRDRIVQHWITIRLEPLLERRFLSQGDVSFNCRKGYGTLRAVQTAKEHIERVSERYKKEAWVAKIDISGFFMSIDKEILLSKLLPFLRENYQGNDLDTFLWLTEVTIRHMPQNFCERRSPIWMWDDLPDNKSLFTMPPEKGMAIGNITSQLLANFYLSYFDEFMNEQCEWNNAGYVRFVDDMIIVSTDKRFLIELRLKAMQWLKKNLKLKLHPDKFYLQEVRKGVKFVGAVIKPGRLYTSSRTLGNMRNRVRGTDRVCRQIIEGGVTKERLRDLKRHVCSLNSYMGFCVHNYTYNQRRKMFNDFPNFWKCCNIQRRFTLVKVKKKFNYESFLIREDAELHKNERAGLPRYGDRRKRLRSKRDDRQRRRDRG